MSKFLLKLWPALTPIVIFLLWRWLRRGKKATAKLSISESRLWAGTLVLSLLIAIICIVVLGMSSGTVERGDYLRPEYDAHGGVVPGKIIPKDE